MVSVQSPVSQDRIIQSLQLASAQTGTDFEYLLETAKRESSLKPQAKAKTSSAAGLFQFIEQTWLGAVKQYGEKAGLEAFSESIGTNAKGRHIVTDDKTKEEILALRHDVDVSSVIAAMMSKDSQTKLETALGRDLREGELYISHFLGVRGAQKFIQAKEADATTKAATLFPAAAKANKRLFYAKDGAQLSIGDVYQNLTHQHGAASLAPKPTPTVRQEPAVPPVTFTQASQHLTPSPAVQKAKSLDIYGLRLAGFSDRIKGALPVSLSSSALPASLVDLSPVILDVLAAIGETPKGSSAHNSAAQSD